MSIKENVDGVIEPATGKHFDIAMFIDQDSPIYTPMNFYIKKDILKYATLGTDNTYPWIGSWFIETFGMQEFGNIAGVLAKFSEYYNKHFLRFIVELINVTY